MKDYYYAEVLFIHGIHRRIIRRNFPLFYVQVTEKKSRDASIYWKKK